MVEPIILCQQTLVHDHTDHPVLGHQTDVTLTLMWTECFLPGGGRRDSSRKLFSVCLHFRWFTAFRKYLGELHGYTKRPFIFPQKSLMNRGVHTHAHSLKNRVGLGRERKRETGQSYLAIFRNRPTWHLLSSRLGASIKSRLGILVARSVPSLIKEYLI